MDDSRPPVSQSPLYRDGKSLLPGLLTCNEGLKSKMSDFQRSPQQAKVLHNVQMHRKRNVWGVAGIGYTVDNSTALNAGAKCLDFGEFISAAGVYTLLVKAGSKLQSYSFSTHTGTDILTGLNSTARPCMRVYSPSTATTQPITVYCDGVREPAKVTSTSAASNLLFNSPAVWPQAFGGKTYTKPKFCEPFADRMVFAGFDGGGASANAIIYDVLITNQGSAEVITAGAPAVATDAYAVTVPAALGPITGIKSFRPSTFQNQQIILIGQEKGVSMISGTNTTNYRLDILTNQYGIVNNRCWAEVLDDLVFLTNRGVANLGALISGAVRPADMLSKDIGDKIENIDFSNAGDAFCVHHPVTQEVQFWVPWTTDSGTAKRGMIMNYNTDGGLANPAWSTKDGFSPSCGIEFQRVMYCGTSDGFIQIHYNADDYNGTQILFQIVLAMLTQGNLMQNGRIRQLYVVTDGQAQKFTINVYALAKRADGTTRRYVCTPAAYALQDGASSITTLPFTLGNSSFPGDHVKTHLYAPIGHGYAFEIELTAGNSANANIDFAGLFYTLSIGGLGRV